MRLEPAADIETIKNGMDKNCGYSFIVDSSPDKWTDYEVTQCIWSCDPTQCPRTLKIDLRAANADNEGVSQILLDSVIDYDLNRELCSSINVDGTAYNLTALRTLSPIFRLAVPIIDPIHVVSNAVRDSYNDDDFAISSQFCTKARNVFKNSIKRRNEYRRYIQLECDPINDGGSMQHFFDNLLPAQIEDIVDQPLRHNVVVYEDDSHRVNVISALSSQISYNSYPPRLIEC